jgi:hypothetical protein
MFLESCISQLDCKDKSIHNLLVYFLAEPAKLDKLNAYLER